MMKTKTTTWLAQIAVMLVLLASGMASGATVFLSWNSPLGENAVEASHCPAAASLSGETHRGCGDPKLFDAAGLFVAPLTRPLGQSGAIRNAAVEVHNLAQTGASRIPVNQSTVAIVEATLPNGTRQLFASGSGGYLNPAQVNRLVEMGVPRENIFSGARYYRGFSAAENHAERVILRNLPEGATVNRWGISWGGRQRPIPCDVCEPFVRQAGGVVEGR